jgi:hypothetical protein
MLAPHEVLPEDPDDPDARAARVREAVAVFYGEFDGRRDKRVLVKIIGE